MVRKKGGDTFTRLSMSLSSDLFAKLDGMVKARGLPSRSQLLSELIHHAVVAHEESVDPDAIVSGTITIIYNSDTGRVRQQISQKQIEYFDEVVSSQYVSIDKNESLEVFIVQGPAARLRVLCDELRALRGVRQLDLVMGSAPNPEDQKTEILPERRRVAA